MPRKKAEPDASKPALVGMSYGYRAEEVFIPTVSTSLMESCRGNLPEDTEGPPELVALAVKCPGLYATFLGKLIAGSSFRAAAFSCGLPPNKIKLWLYQGSTDLANDYDSYCARFLLDYQRAASIAVSDAEERVHRADPSKWLGRSPTGKEFNKGVYWQEQAKTSVGEELPIDDATIDPPPTRPVIEDASGNTTNDHELKEAMKVLEGLQITTNPEFIKQAKEQFRLTDDKTE